MHKLTAELQRLYLTRPPVPAGAESPPPSLAGPDGTVRALFKGISPIPMMLAAFPIVLIASVFSWHFIEKPAMSRRHAFAATLNNRLDGVKAYWAGAGKGAA